VKNSQPVQTSTTINKTPNSRSTRRENRQQDASSADKPLLLHLREDKRIVKQDNQQDSQIAPIEKTVHEKWACEVEKTDGFEKG
jgi:hypothetical protein